MPSNHLILCRPLLLLPSIFPRIRVFSNESVLCIRWPKNWSFSFSISSSNEYSRLISFRMNWLNLLAVQGALKSLLQHHSPKASFFRCSAFFTVQLSHPYMTTGKTMALTRWTFVGKVMSLLFNMLSRLVIAFLPRSKYLLISWLQSPSSVVLPYIDMNQPWVYMCSPSWYPLSPPSLSHPSGSSQCTNPEHSASCVEPGLVIYFAYDNVHVSMLFSQIVPLSPSPTESKIVLCFKF